MKRTDGIIQVRGKRKRVAHSIFPLGNGGFWVFTGAPVLYHSNWSVAWRAFAR